MLYIDNSPGGLLLLAILNLTVFFTLFTAFQNWVVALVLGLNASFIAIGSIPPSMFPENQLTLATTHLALVGMFLFLSLAVVQTSFVLGLLLFTGPLWNAARISMAHAVGVQEDSVPLIVCTLLLFFLVAVLVQYCSKSIVSEALLYNIVASTLAYIALRLMYLYYTVADPTTGIDVYCSSQQDSPCLFVISKWTVLKLLLLFFTRVWAQVWVELRYTCRAYVRVRVKT
jgi:hypothetical protein